MSVAIGTNNVSLPRLRNNNRCAEPYILKSVSINVKKVKALLLGIVVLITVTLKAQYPYERYPALNYQKKYYWTFYDRTKNENKMHWTMTFAKFFDNNDSLTVQLTTFVDKDYSYIRIFRNRKQTQLIKEPYPIGRYFGTLEDTVYYGDINGDSLTDIKILCWYGGCGIASLNERVVYLIQRPDHSFTKISYLDMSACVNIERDFDGDHNYEIITMTLNSYQEHSYWTFNLFNVVDGGLVSVNNKFDYPIMIQFLNRTNYQITDKISRLKMKKFAQTLPEEYDRR